MNKTLLGFAADIARGGIAKGVTLDNVKKAGLPNAWKPWANDSVTVERWVETLYTSLKK